MKRLLVIIVTLFMISSAQAQQVEEKIQACKDSIDVDTAWGEWMSSVVVYFDDMAKIAEKTILVPESYEALEAVELTSEQMLEKTRLKFSNYLEELKGLEPPMELIMYHQLVCDLINRSFVQSGNRIDYMDSYKRIALEADQEIKAAVQEKGVPQNVLQQCEFLFYSGHQ